MCDLLQLQRRSPPSRAACQFVRAFCTQALPRYVPQDGLLSTPPLVMQLLELITETVHRFLRGEYAKQVPTTDGTLTAMCAFGCVTFVHAHIPLNGVLIGGCP